MLSPGSPGVPRALIALPWADGAGVQQLPRPLGMSQSNALTAMPAWGGGGHGHCASEWMQQAGQAVSLICPAEASSATDVTQHGPPPISGWHLP